MCVIYIYITHNIYAYSYITFVSIYSDFKIHKYTLYIYTYFTFNVYLDVHAMYIYITIQYYIFAFLVCNMTYDVLELEDTWKAPELVDSSCDFGSLDDIPCLPSLQGQSDDHQNSLERFDGTIEGRTSQSHGSWIMSHEAINDCISWKEEIEKSKQRHNTLQDQFREASACLSVTLAYARPWPHSLRELKAKMTNICFCVCGVFCMMTGFWCFLLQV